MDFCVCLTALALPSPCIGSLECQPESSSAPLHAFKGWQLTCHEILLQLMNWLIPFKRFMACFSFQINSSFVRAIHQLCHWLQMKSVFAASYTEAGGCKTPWALGASANWSVLWLSCIDCRCAAFFFSPSKDSGEILYPLRTEAKQLWRRWWSVLTDRIWARWP